jgi:tRNA-uridine 2-sulfurtransferase
MRILVAMSGGVDSSVAAAILREEGHDIAGATLRLWGGPSDSGCCSVADVDDARRVAQQLDMAHYVFNFSDDFDTHVVNPYVAAHQEGRTPNPCVECNRHVKFDLFAARAERLGYDAIATGHHVRRVELPDGRFALGRGHDNFKDQSYVVHMIGQSVLAKCIFPVGALTKTEVRAHATALNLRTADKAESMDVCFIAKTDGGRRVFLGSRIPLRSARIVDTAGREVGTTDAVELVTIGQRRGLGQLGVPEARYVIDVDVPGQTVTIGTPDEMLVESLLLEQFVDSVGVFDLPIDGGPLLAQTSAHGEPFEVRVRAGADGSVLVTFTEPRRRVAPGQTVVLYRGDIVAAGGVVAASRAVQH